MRTAVVSVAALLAVSGIFCGRTGPGRDLRLTVPPIPDGETSRYVLRAGDQPIGTTLVILSAGVFRDRPAWRFELITLTSSSGIATTDSSIVFVSRDSLRPLSSFRFLKVGPALTTTAVNYVREAAAITTFAAGEETQRLLPFDRLTYDTEELLFLFGRAIVLTKGRPVEFKAVSPMGPPAGGGLFACRAELLGEETVTVPAGTFDCRKVLFNIGPQPYLGWFEKAGPQRLVRYETPAGEVTRIAELLPPGN